MSIHKNISDTQRDFKSPLSEDLMERYDVNQEMSLEYIRSEGVDQLLAGAIDSVSTTDVVDANPTIGTIDQDDKYDGLYLHFTSGSVFSANSRNRFKIVGTVAGTDTLTLDTNVAALGAAASDTYVLLGHTHDGAATDPDGAKIDLKNLLNVAEDQSMTQDLADAITDPDGIRSANADKAEPFATVGDVATRTQLDTAIGTGTDWLSSDAGTLIFTATNTTGTTTYDISGTLPAGTKRCTVVCAISVTGTPTNTGFLGTYNVNSAGTGHDATEMRIFNYSVTSGVISSVGKWPHTTGNTNGHVILDLPVTNDREIRFRFDAGSGVTISARIRAWPRA